MSRTTTELSPRALGRAYGHPPTSRTGPPRPAFASWLALAALCMVLLYAGLSGPLANASERAAARSGKISERLP